jgi:hypothetical protein
MTWLSCEQPGSKLGRAAALKRVGHFPISMM